MMRRVPCIDKLHALTGFRPQTSLVEIIDRVSAYFRQEDGLLPAHLRQAFYCLSVIMTSLLCFRDDAQAYFL